MNGNLVLVLKSTSIATSPERSTCIYYLLLLCRMLLLNLTIAAVVEQAADTKYTGRVYE